MSKNMPIMVQIGPLVPPGREPKESKKKEKGKDSKERNLKWQTGCSPRPPTSCEPGGLREVVIIYKFQVSSQLQRVTDSNMHIDCTLLINPKNYNLSQTATS